MSDQRRAGPKEYTRPLAFMTGPLVLVYNQWLAILVPVKYYSWWPVGHSWANDPALACATLRVVDPARDIARMRRYCLWKGKLRQVVLGHHKCWCGLCLFKWRFGSFVNSPQSSVSVAYFFILDWIILLVFEEDEKETSLVTLFLSILSKVTIHVSFLTRTLHCPFILMASLRCTRCVGSYSIFSLL